MQSAHAETVLRALGEVYKVDDVQQLVDRVCGVVAEITSYRLVLISLYFEGDAYIGLEGGDEDLRRSFLEVAQRTPDAARQRKRKEIWERHRIPGTSICFIPEGSAIPFSSSFTRSEEDRPGQEWRPEDRLMVFVRGMDGEVRGVLSLDRPADGRRPDPNDLGPLEAVDRFIAMMGVLIHNKHLAAKLRESEERYAAVVEQGHDAILIVRDGRILFANRRMAEMTGTDPERLIGRPFHAVVQTDENGCVPGEKEGQLLGADGTRHDVVLRRSTIRFGGASAELIAAADITEHKRLLNHLLRAQKMETVGTLASGIAHDFNNLLSGILGYASLLKAYLDEDHRAAQYVDSIEKAADRAADVTRQLLGLVRGAEPRMTPFPIARVLGEVANLLGETLDPGIEVVVRCDPDLPHVRGDESQIHQVLLNVCVNARDAMPDGGTLTLAATRARSRAERELVRVHVHDTGSGMDDETLAKLFDPFFTTKEGGSGTGLGLYMAYRVIERHGGSIDVASRAGSGTTVEIVLPATTDEAADRDQGLPEGAPSGSGTVLLVDDEELIRHVAGEMLRDLGYEVHYADNGKEAVERVRTHPGRFVCVLLDIAMPVMNGWEAARQIRRIDPDLPLLISSGHEVDATSGLAHGLPGVRSLKKPYRVSELREVLAGVARRPVLTREIRGA